MRSRSCGWLPSRKPGLTRGLDAERNRVPLCDDGLLHHLGEPAGAPEGDGIALALFRGRDRADDALDLPAGAVSRELRCSDPNRRHWRRCRCLDQPRWNVRQRARRSQPCVYRPDDDVSALGAGIDTTRHAAGAVSQARMMIEEQMLSAGAGRLLPGFRQVWRASLKPFGRLDMSGAVDVEDEQPARLAGRNVD
jgi:hypothetical protein